MTYTKKGVSKNIKEHLKAMGFKQNVLDTPNDSVSYVVRCCCFSSDLHKVPLPRDMTDEDFQLYEKIMMEIIDVLAKYKRGGQSVNSSKRKAALENAMKKEGFFGLSTRARNSLIRAGINNYEDLVDKMKSGEEVEVRQFGKGHLEEVKKLTGLSLEIKPVDFTNAFGDKYRVNFLKLGDNT